MQTASTDTLATFVNAATPAMDKLAMVHACLRASVGTSVLLAMPSSKCRVDILAPVILCARIDENDYILGIASSMSAAVSLSTLLQVVDLLTRILICPFQCIRVLQLGQDASGFVLRHASMPSEAYTHVVKLMPGMILEQPMTWAESLSMPRNLDKAYGLDVDTLSRLAATLPTLFSWHYPSVEDVVSAICARACLLYRICHQRPLSLPRPSTAGWLHSGLHEEDALCCLPGGQRAAAHTDDSLAEQPDPRAGQLGAHRAARSHDGVGVHNRQAPLLRSAVPRHQHRPT